MNATLKTLLLSLFIGIGIAGFFLAPQPANAAACNFSNTNIRIAWTPSSPYDMQGGTSSYSYSPGTTVARSYGELSLNPQTPRNWTVSVNVTNNGVTKTLSTSECNWAYINGPCYTQTGDQDIGGATFNMFFEVQSYIKAEITCTPSPEVTPDLIGQVGGARTVQAEQPVTLYGAIANSGGNAGAFENIIQVCDQSCFTLNRILSATTLSSLAAGSSAAISATFTPAATPGVTDYMYRVCANTRVTTSKGSSTWSNPATESNYANNCSGWQSLTIQQAPVPPTANLTLTPASIAYGGASILQWGSTNATSCTGTNFSTGGATSGSVSVTATQNTTYTVTCTGAAGSASDSELLSVGAQPQPDLVAGTVTAGSPQAGVSATLSADVTNVGPATSGSFPILFQVSETGALAQSGYLAALGSGASRSGSASYTFPAAGTYQVRACANYNTSWTAITTESNYANNCGPWTTITVSSAPQPPALSCSVSPTSVALGGSVTYRANPSGGASGPYTWVAADGGSYGTGATVTRTFTASGTYAMNVDTSSTARSYCPNVTVTSNACSGASTNLTITATPERVRAGQSSTITWNATGVNGESATCTVSGPGISWSSPVSAAPQCSVGGSASATIASQSTYTLTCGGVSENVVVNVIPKIIEF
ncbi:MAG TPA: CARDB domain-containing protein [Candidatus Paceibacterota bacterium]